MDITLPTLPAKPKLRGWLHLGMAPLVFITGLVFTIFAPTLDARIGCGVYTLAAVQLFGTSAVYHRGNWSVRALGIFRRVDHSNIFIFIAGTYTPLALTMLTGPSRWSLLILIWSIALLGVAFRIVWLSAPRWLYTMLYVAMGWAALGWLNQFWAAGGPAVVVLLLAGGLVYSLGHQEPRPVPDLVRVPRGLPLLHHRRRRPARRGDRAGSLRLSRGTGKAASALVYGWSSRHP